MECFVLEYWNIGSIVHKKEVYIHKKVVKVLIKVVEVPGSYNNCRSLQLSPPCVPIIGRPTNAIPKAIDSCMQARDKITRQQKVKSAVHNIISIKTIPTEYKNQKTYCIVGKFGGH